ncbi:MAG: hypothetical protein JJU42_07490 [Rhodobacteraceae bacterium]|nr:hypothetical protein [Paracoccaceae bacterium]
MSTIDATALLAAERWLRFHDLHAGPGFGAVTLWVDAAEPSDTQSPLGSGSARIDRIIGPVHAIESGPDSLRYRIVFRDCVAWAWRDESYALPEDGEDTSTMLRRYARSAFLDYTRRTGFAESMTARPLEHFAVVTLDAILDVLCPDPPEVTARPVPQD